MDFTSDSPTVISGFHNLSSNASERNDENHLIIRGYTDVADCYGCEVMRLYDHYRFRHAVKRKKDSRPPTLMEDDSWAKHYFSGPEGKNLASLDSEKFSG